MYRIAITLFLILITLSISAQNDETSIVVAPDNQISGGEITSDQIDCNTPVDVFAFDVNDLGPDGNPTNITNIRLKTGDANTAAWTTNIQNVKINNGSGYIPTENVTITDEYIDISIASGNLNIGDGHAGTITVAICLNESGLSGGAVLSFKVDDTNHGFTAAAEGSMFSATFPSVVESENFTISILCTTPTTHSSMMNFDNTTENSTGVSWTSGDGSGRILVARAGEEVDAIPADGITYTSNTVFGLGDEISTENFVVYAGHSNSVNITGLTENTQYFFKVFEYNCSVGEEKYLTIGTPAFGNVTTSATEISSLNSGLQIYPNPTTGLLYVNNINNENNVLDIKNVLGQKVKSFSFDSNINRINLSQFNKGIYFIILTTQNKKSIQKIVVK